MTGWASETFKVFPIVASSLPTKTCDSFRFVETSQSATAETFSRSVTTPYRLTTWTKDFTENETSRLIQLIPPLWSALWKKIWRVSSETFHFRWPHSHFSKGYTLFTRLYTHFAECYIHFATVYSQFAYAYSQFEQVTCLFNKVGCQFINVYSQYTMLACQFNDVVCQYYNVDSQDWAL